MYNIIYKNSSELAIIYYYYYTMKILYYTYMFNLDGILKKIHSDRVTRNRLTEDSEYNL